MLLIDCIEDCINKKLKALDDEIKDEEEDGNSETSRPRASQTSDSILIHKDNVRVYAKQAQTVLKSYENLISRKEIIYIKNDECIQKEDLSLFALSLFVAAEICYLNRFKYVFAPQMEKSHYQKVLIDSLDHVIECEGIKVLERFSSFCRKCVRTNNLNADVINMSQKAMKYMLLFVMFYDRFSPNKIYNEKKVKKAVDDLIMIWGLPEKKRTEKELETLIENYDHVFEFRYVEQALKRLGYIW